MLTSTGSLNSRIQSQQVGLTGNAPNFLNEIFNLFRSYIQLINISHSSLNHFTNIIDSFTYLINGIAVLFSQRRRFLALLQAGDCCIRNIMGRTGNFHYTGRSLLKTAGIYLALGANGQCQFIQLIQGAPELTNSPQ